MQQLLTFFYTAIGHLSVTSMSLITFNGDTNHKSLHLPFAVVLGNNNRMFRMYDLLLI